MVVCHVGGSIYWRPEVIQPIGALIGAQVSWSIDQLSTRQLETCNCPFYTPTQLSSATNLPPAGRLLANMQLQRQLQRRLLSSPHDRAVAISFRPSYTPPGGDLSILRQHIQCCLMKIDLPQAATWANIFSLSSYGGSILSVPPHGRNGEFGRCRWHRSPVFSSNRSSPNPNPINRWIETRRVRGSSVYTNSMHTHKCPIGWLCSIAF